MSEHNEIRLIWHRRDLRLHDNPLYDETKCLISVYIFDVSYFRPRPSTSCPLEWMTVDVGPHAARILIETVSQLRDNLRAKGGELLIRCGDPVALLPSLAKEIGATEVCWSEEPGVYEARKSRELQQMLKNQVHVSTFCSYTLYHPEDIPRGSNEWAQLAHPRQNKSKKKRKQKQNESNERDVPLDTLLQKHGTKNQNIVDISPARFDGAPKIMGDFRRVCREYKPLRPSLPTPTVVKKPNLPDNLDIGELPSLNDLTRPLLDSNMPILGMGNDILHSIVMAAQERGESNDPWISRGGEHHAIQRLNDFINHAATANRSLADVSENGSSKLAVHLAMGSISPRVIVETAKQRGDDCSWLVSHLEMRDFFLYTAMIAGCRLFHVNGMPLRKGMVHTWHSPVSTTLNKKHWVCWALGQTGLPLVDAAMVELRTTGYTSNRVRQNAASVLTKDLGLEWRAGAEWYQLLLEDYCVGANWGNWMYFAGVGSDPKQRHFRTVSQAKRYDPNGDYVSKWIPRLTNIGSVEMKLQPWNFIEDWGEVIVDPRTQYTWQDLQELDDKSSQAIENCTNESLNASTFPSA